MNVDKHLKTQAFIIISDIFMECYNKALENFNMIMPIVRDALLASKMNVPLVNILTKTL